MRWALPYLLWLIVILAVLISLSSCADSCCFHADTNRNCNVIDSVLDNV